MRLQRIFATAVVASAVFFSGPLAIAHGLTIGRMNMIAPDSQSFNGSWPVTVTHSHHTDFMGCLTLATISGANVASLVIGSQKYPSGSFLVINHILVATVTAQAYSQNAGLVLIAPATHGNLGNGVFEDVYGGSNFDSGALTFGMKGGC